MGNKGIVEHSPRQTSWRDTEHYWTVQIIGSDGNARSGVMCEAMTPAMNIMQLAKLRGQQKPKGNPHPANMYEVLQFATRAYNLREEFPEQAESLRTTLQNGMRRYANTTTVVAYNPEGQQDEVIHDYQTSDSKIIQGDFVGCDGDIEKVQPLSLLEATLGTRDIDEINNIAQWLNNTPAYLWRVNSKPQKRDERVARFVAGSYGLDFGCDWNPQGQYPAFRVLVEE